MMGMVETISDVLEEWGQELCDDFRTSLAQSGAYGSGELSRSIIPVVYTKPNTKGTMDVYLEVRMADHWSWVNDGRKPGKAPPFTPKSPIAQWIKNSTKGAGLLASFKSENKLKDSIKATRSLAFLIGRKIAKNGTRSTHFIDSVYTQGRLLQLQMMLQEKIGERANELMENIQLV